MGYSTKSNLKYAQDRRREDRLERDQKTKSDVERTLGIFLEKQNFNDRQSLGTPLYQHIYDFIEKNQTSIQWRKYAYALFRDYIKKHNQQSLEPLELPEVIFTIKRDTPVISFDFLENGKDVILIKDHLLSYWQLTAEESTFSSDEVIGNILMSAILYGGLNQEASLEALLEHLRSPQPVQNIEGFTVIFLTPLSKNYGDITISPYQLGKSRQFVPDHLTKLWLFHYYHKKIKHPSLTVQDYLAIIFKKMRLEFSPQIYNSLLQYAHYHWSQLPDVHLDPATTHCLTEKILTCGLCSTEFQRYLKPQFRTTPPVTSHPSKAKKNQFNPAEISVSANLQKNISDVKKIHKDLLRIINAKKTEKPIVVSLIEKCMDLTSILNEYTQRLALWLISLYQPTYEQISQLAEKFNCSPRKICQSYEKYARLKDSSIYSYYTLIGETWLIHSVEYLEQNDDVNESLNSIYEQMIANRRAQESLKIENEPSTSHTDQETAKQNDQLTTNKDAPFIKMLERFHRFQRVVFGAEDFDFGPIQQYHQPRARIIGPKTYQILQQKLKVLTRTYAQSEHDYVMLRLIYALAYRTGMRINEILGIRLKDIEGLEDFSLWVQPYGSKKIGNQHQLKTKSAQRILPLYCLLDDEEKKLLHDHIVKARSSKKPSSYLFHAWNNSARLSPHDVTTPFKLMMNEFFDEHDYVFHSFRHTAANNLSLILNCQNLALTQKLTGLSKEKIDQIRECLVRSPKGQDNWFLLSHLLGHIDPTESFRSYLHLNYFIGGTILSNYQPNLKFSTVKKMLGLDSSQTVFSETDDQRKFSFNKYFDVIHQKISAPHQTWLKSDSRRVLKGLQLEASTQHNYFDYFAGTPESKINYDLFFQALKLLELYQDAQKVASQLNLPHELVQYWYTNALALTQLKSRAGTCKLFKHNFEKFNSLKPVMLIQAEDKESLEYFFKHLQVEFNRSPKMIEFILNVFLDRVSFSKPGITYPWKHIGQLETFYHAIHPLFPKKFWLISGKDIQNQLNNTQAKTDMLQQLLNSHSSTQINAFQDYARLQLYSRKYKKSLNAFKVCLHLACIGRPRSISLTI